MDKKLIIVLVVVVLVAAGLAAYFLIFNKKKKGTPSPVTAQTTTTTSESPTAPSPDEDEEDEEDEEDYDTVVLGEDVPTYSGSGDLPPDVKPPSPKGPPPSPKGPPPSPKGPPPSPKGPPPGPAGPIKATISCATKDKTASVSVAANPAKTPMSLFSPQKKTGGGLIKAGIVSGTVKVGPLAWIDPKKPVNFYLATSPANYKAQKYVAQCTRPGITTPPPSPKGPPPGPAGPIKATISCATKDKTVAISVAANPAKTPMSLFSPQKKTGGGLIKAGIVSGTVKVGPLAWIDPKKPVNFYLATSPANYKAKKYVAQCTRPGITTPPPGPAGPIRARISCATKDKTVAISVAANPAKTPMSLFSPQKKTGGGLVKAGIVSGTVKVGPLAWIDPKKPVNFYLATSLGNYKAQKYVAQCTRPGIATPPPSPGVKPLSVTIKCVGTKVPKTVTVVVRSNPKNVPMKLFSPQKPGNDGLVKYNIVKGKITVGPLAWMDPAKKTTFVVAKTNADYKARKWIARCVTEPKKPTEVVIKCSGARKTATVIVRSNPKNTPMKLFSPQKPGNDGLIKHTITKGKIAVGPLAWMDPAKKTTFVVAKTNADYKARKWIARCVTAPTTKPSGPGKVRRVLWIPADYLPGSKMRGFHDFNVRLRDKKFEIVDGVNRSVDVGKAIAANAAALKGCEKRGDPKSQVGKNPKKLRECMRTWHAILGNNTGNNIKLDPGKRTAGTYRGGVDGGINIPAGMKIAISGSTWKNFTIRLNGKVAKGFVFKKMNSIK